MIETFFGASAAIEMGRSGETAFKKQLYQSMVAQALFLKTEIEGWRSQNVFGTTIWMCVYRRRFPYQCCHMPLSVRVSGNSYQDYHVFFCRRRYNDMWPSGGWGSIEYGSAQPGQVTGGRWKPLHYIFKASTFADQMSTCNTAGACFVRNDSPFAFSGQATVRLLNVVTGKSVAMNQHALALAPGAGVTEWYCADKAAGKTERAAEALAGATYTRHSLQVPLDRNNYTKQVGCKQCGQPADEAGCEAACNAEPKCLGFTLMGGAMCWLYDVVPSLHNDPEADWWQKPGTRPIPAPPPPPPPPARQPRQPHHSVRAGTRQRRG